MIQPGSRTYLWTLAFLSGAILSLAWSPMPLALLLFAGFIPLLILEDHFAVKYSGSSGGKLFPYIYVSLLIWNAATTWWIWNASPGGAIMAIVANALLMTIPFIGFHQARKALGPKLGYFSLPIFWLSFEYIHLQWELTWPWLNLGNGLAAFPEWVQWYEYTGTLGGTAWIIGMNMLIFFAIRPVLQQNPVAGKPPGSLFSRHWKWATLGLVPILGSYGIYYTYQQPPADLDVTVVQPNIDPYNDKFGGLSSEEQLEILLKQSAKKTDGSTNYLVWPETALYENIWLNRIQNYPSIKRIRKFLEGYPGLTLITGISAARRFDHPNASPTARYYSTGKCCYDAYNTAIQINSREDIPFYHKSKLVPGVERMPYPFLFKFLENFAIDLGGITGSLGTQTERSVFFNTDSIGIAPVICYESVFGEYVTEYIKNGAHVIFIITNDGWWGNTPGHRQHLQYASLRAIENRISIARSANTGISCFINPRGDLEQTTQYWQGDVIRQKIPLRAATTFYSRNGDYIGRVAVLLAICLVLLTFVSNRTEKFKHRINKI